jgi:anti-sigma B factor antagonist
MSIANLTTDVRKAGSSACVIEVHGEINAQAENALTEAYNQACDLGARNIILNFNDLSYMNSSGIGLLVTMLIRANRQKQRIMAYGLSEHYRQIFELTRLDEAIVLLESEAEGLAVA